jgi:hypothetical protein
MAGAPFAPAIEQQGPDGFERMLRHLGRGDFPSTASRKRR